MKNCLLRVLVFFLIIVLICFLLLSLTPKPLFKAINLLPLEANLTKPENYSLIEQQARVKTNITYSNRFPESSLDIYSPTQVKGKLPVILFVHGGGFFKGDKEMAKYFGPAMTDNRYAFVSINYNLVPNATIFDQVRQLNEAIDFISQHAEEYSLDVQHLNLAGSSAGGFLALQLLAAYHDSSYAAKLAIQPVNSIQFSSLLLYSAVYDLAEFQAYDDGVLIRYLLGKFGWSLTGVKDWQTNQEFAQLLKLSNYISRDFPPVFITDGNTRTFTNQAMDYAEELKRHGVLTDTLFFNTKQEVGHGYQLNMESAASQQAVQRSLTFLSMTNP